MSTLTNSLESVRSWWQSSLPATRAAATAIALLLVIALIYAITLAASPNYVSIYNGVSGTDASAIQGVLQGHSIPMQYSDTDQSISVPAKDQSNAIMYIEAAGILSPSAKIVGLSSLDSTSITASPDIINVKINAAREGELERMLMQLDPIQYANVKLSGGNDGSLFDDGTPATASAVLTVRPGDNLTSDQAKGIAYLLARAVPGLNAKNVTLTDQTGNPLWPNSNLAGGNNQSNADARFAERERVKLQNLLDSTIGTGKSQVTVNAELNFDQVNKEIVQHLPTVPGGSSTLPISTSEKDESYSGAGAPSVGGPAGTSSNLNAPSYSSSSSTSAGGKFKSTDTLTNYADNVDTTSIIAAPGGLKRLMVGVLIDSSVAPSTATAIQREVSTLVGVAPSDPTRQVIVQQIPFDTSAQKLAQAALHSQQSQALWANVIKALVALAVVGALLFLATRGPRGTLAPQMALAGEGAHLGLLDRTLPGSLDDTMLEERPLRIEDVLAEMPEVMPTRSRRRTHAPAIEEQPDIKLESVQDMIAGSPQAVALLLKGWMAEDAVAQVSGK